MNIDELEKLARAAPTQPSPAESDKEAVRNAALEEAKSILDEIGEKLQKAHDYDDNSYWMGVGAMVEAGEKAIHALKSQPAPATTQSGVLMVQENDTISYNHPEYGPGIFFTEDCVIDQSAQLSGISGELPEPSDRQAEVSDRGEK